MSYILDALKKAEAERRVGGVPSIHAATPGTGKVTEEKSFLHKFLPWIISGLLLLIMLAYMLWSHPWSTAATAPGAVAPAPAQSPPVAASEPASAPQPPQPAPLPQAPAPATPVHQAPPAVEKPARPAPPPSAVAEKPKADEAGSSASATAPGAASTAPAPEEEAGTVQDLPAAIQRELPPVTINGYIYARNPADRSALINKKLLHEGENIAPDLVLEKLTPKGAVLNFKGYRYRISY
ncbi:MAG TPA: general secretion pathway protein GspB [Burkholderiaceae bacterium]